MNLLPKDIDRFWRKVIKGTNGDCWSWSGYVGKSGYVQFFFNGKLGLAHRFSYMLHYGPIPDGEDIDHICRNRSCTNPAHLRVLSHRENVLCGNTRPAKHAAQTHCLRGHPFTPENTYLNPRGERQCRKCMSIRAGKLPLGQLPMALHI